MLGLEPPAQFQGRAFAGPARAPAPEFAFMFRDRMDERYDTVRAVSDGRYRYIRNYYPDRPLGQRINFLWKQASMQEWETHYRSGNLNAAQRRFFEPEAVEELYDLDREQDNLHNLAGDPAHADRLARFRAALHAHQLAVRDTGFMLEPMMGRAGRGRFARRGCRRRRPLPARAARHARRRHRAVAAGRGRHRARRRRRGDPAPRQRCRRIGGDQRCHRANAAARTAAVCAERAGSFRSADPKGLRPLLGQLAASDDFTSFDYYLARVARPLLAR